MKTHIIDYLNHIGHIAVSPIWGGEKEFNFLCLGHIEIAKALGFELQCITPYLTIVKENQITSKKELDNIIFKNQFDYSVFDREIEYLLNLKNEYPNKLCGGGCFGPLTVVSGILGAENMLKLIIKNPLLVEDFVDYVTGFLIQLAKLESEKDGDFFWIAEPLASLLSPKKFWHFSGRYLKKIYDSSGVPGFLHVCGKTLNHTEYMVQTGAEVLSIDYCTDIGECIRLVDKNIVIMGNVSPNILKYGTKTQIKNEVNDILCKCNGFDNFILSTGCSIMEETPKENMQILFEINK